MNDLTAYIESGILELYVLGVAGPEESRQVDALAAAHPEVRKALDEIGRSMEQYALAHAVTPHDAVRPMVLAAIDYTDRLKNGEPVSFPPLLGKGSHPEAFAEWTSRPDMVLPETDDELYAKIIGYTPQATTAIVWIKTATPFEMHNDEYERFLILEGTCDFHVGEQVFPLKAGDFMEIPLNTGHTAKVTSNTPCKVILQRVAA